MKSQPDLEITRKDSICVMIAGLCHDLGHGPCSHLWEAFMKKANPALNFRHEDYSIKMLDHLIEKNNPKNTLNELEEITDVDILFIKELIAGPIDETTGLSIKEESQDDNGEWKYRGRTKKKSFLYEIIANHVTGIDVDKMDYIVRDNKHFKIGQTFDVPRFFMFARVIKTGTPERYRICLSAKEAYAVEVMYHIPPQAERSDQ